MNFKKTTATGGSADVKREEKILFFFHIKKKAYLCTL